MHTLLVRFLKDESGATALEYGLIATLVSIGIIAAVTATGMQVSTTYNKVNTSMSSAQ